jgi:hypothetical protein
MKYRNRIPEPETTISGFADNKGKNINHDRPTLADFLKFVFISAGRHLLKLFYDELCSFSTFFALNFDKKLAVE